MKKIILSFFACLFMAQSSFAANPMGIKELMDNYQYAVEVEWDQKDQQFIEQQEKNFSEGLKTLIAEGQSPRALLNEVLAQVPNEQFKTEVMEGLSLAAREEIGPEKLNEMIMGLAAKTHSQGASWSTLAKIGVGVVVALVVARLAVEIYFNEWGKKF